MNSSRKAAYYGIFAALAILMGYIELLVPMTVVVPGMKLGIANVVVIIVLYFMDAKSAFFISIVRIIISGLLFSGFAGFLYSLSGALFSLFIMLVLKSTGIFGMAGVSVAGGIFHNIGQIIVAALVVNNINMFYYLPVLLISGVVTGFFTGIVAQYSIGYLNKGKNV